MSTHRGNQVPAQLEMVKLGDKKFGGGSRNVSQSPTNVYENSKNLMTLPKGSSYLKHRARNADIGSRGVSSSGSQKNSRNGDIRSG